MHDIPNALFFFGFLELLLTANLTRFKKNIISIPREISFQTGAITHLDQISSNNLM